MKSFIVSVGLVLLAQFGWAHTASYYTHYTNSGAQLSLVLNTNQSTFADGTVLELQIRAFNYITGRTSPGPTAGLPVQCLIDGQPVATVNAPWSPYGVTPVSAFVPLGNLPAGQHVVAVEHTNTFEYLTETMYVNTSTHSSWGTTYYHTYYNVYHHWTVPCTASSAFTVLPHPNLHRMSLAMDTTPTNVLADDAFSGPASDSPNGDQFNVIGQATLDGNGCVNLNTTTVNQSTLMSKASAVPQWMHLRFRASAYAEGTRIYGDGQPRGLRVGNNPNNAIEFYSVAGTTLGIRTIRNGVASTASFPLPSGVNSFHDYEIQVTPGAATFILNETVLGKLTNNLPTGPLNFHVTTHDGYAGNVPVTLDNVRLNTEILTRLLDRIRGDLK